MLVWFGRKKNSCGCFVHLYNQWTLHWRPHHYLHHINTEMAACSALKFRFVFTYCHNFLSAFVENSFCSVYKVALFVPMVRQESLKHKNFGSWQKTTTQVIKIVDLLLWHILYCDHFTLWLCVQNNVEKLWQKEYIKTVPAFLQNFPPNFPESMSAFLQGSPPNFPPNFKKLF